MDARPLLRIDDLNVHFALPDGDVSVIRNVDLVVPESKTVCLVGESGCGKSVTAKAILRVLDRPGYIRSGRIALSQADGPELDIAALDARAPRLRQLRGGEIGMIHQEPMSFLSPLYTIGNQIVEALRLHHRLGKTDARREAVEMLRQVGMPEPEQRFDRYTFELSGGQRQRAMIAMALVAAPRLLIADEPTTALDVTTQANILDLLKTLQRQRGMAMLFITHDLGVVAEIADEVAVMYLGQIVEQGPARTVLANPAHPYTQGLLASMPRLDGDFRAPLRAIRGMVPLPAARPSGCPFHPRCDRARTGICDRVAPPRIDLADGQSVACHAHGPDAALFATAAGSPPAAVEPAAVRAMTPPRRLVTVDRLSKHFPIRSGLLSRRQGEVRAVSEVSFDIRAGETLGLVGESGCGKSTLGQTLVGLYRPDGGGARFALDDGPEFDPASANGRQRRQLRTDVRMVFQDPSGSLNPRLTVRDIIGEVLEINGGLTRAGIDARVEDLLVQVGLDPAYALRYPHAFSGGQRQRIAIARALASRPKLVIADEAVSALDVSVQTQIINLMKALQRRYGLTYLFISHDLSVIANISDRVAVMYAGRVVEMGDTEAIFLRPRHPYTEALLAAVPGRSRDRPPAQFRIEGQPPLLAAEPVGCSFSGRCPFAQERCRHERPELRVAPGPQSVACHRADELTLHSPVAGGA
ncbi:MAG: ABC transporter ATP-binding protein [Devosia sp.]|nr:ABC transporter ATP-binding protein [Devosia sp.]